MRSNLPDTGSPGTPGRDLFSQLHREVDRLFGDFAGGFPLRNWPGGEGLIGAKIDVAETDEALEVTAELPGIEEKDIEVTLNNDLLTIKAEKKVEKDSKDKTYHLVERTYGSIQRTISVPFAANGDKVDARFDKGVLKVILPKPPEAESKSHKITIKG